MIQEAKTFKFGRRKVTLSLDEQYEITISYIRQGAESAALEAVDILSKFAELYKPEDIEKIAEQFVQEFWLSDRNDVERQVWKKLVKLYDHNLLEQRAKEVKALKKEKAKKKKEEAKKQKEAEATAEAEAPATEEVEENDLDMFSAE